MLRATTSALSEAQAHNASSTGTVSIELVFYTVADYALYQTTPAQLDLKGNTQSLLW